MAISGFYQATTTTKLNVCLGSSRYRVNLNELEEWERIGRGGDREKERKGNRDKIERRRWEWQLDMK